MAGKIVIVDEEGPHSSDTLERIREALPDREVLCVASETASAEEICCHEPDVILIDVLSVGVQLAMDLCGELRGRQAVCAPLVMVSAVLVNASDRIRAFEAGAHGALSRPFNSRELLSELTMLTQLGVIAPDCLVPGAGGDRIACANLRFRLIFGHSPDAVLLVDSSGEILEVNQTACNLLGLLRKDLLGVGIVALVGEAEKDGVMAGFGELLDGESDAIDEFQFESSEASMALEITAGCRVKGAGGRMSILLHIRDASRAPRVTDALRESRIRAEAVLNTAVDGIITIDERGVIETFNRAAEEIFGYAAAEVVGQSVNRLIPEPHSGRHDGYIRRYLETREKRIIGYGRKVMGLKKDGSEFPIELSVSEVNVGERRLFTGIVRDLTERKKAESERDRLAMAIRQAAEAVVITETNGNILYVNPAFEKDTGYAFEEVLGRNPRILKSGRHDKEFFRDMWLTLEKGKVWQGHLVDRRKNGTLFDVYQIITPIADENGRIVNFVSVWRDVTREKQLEEQVRQSQKMDGIGRLASGIAHDFNNVLAAMMGYGEMLQVKAQSHPELAGIITEILSNANRASNLTRQLLAFSRRQSHEIQPVNLNEVLRQMHSLLRRSLTNDIELVTLFGEEIGYVRGDFGQLEQVILNLAINARDAMKGRPDAKLVIETMRREVSEADADCWVDAEAGDHVMISVRDNGQGMDKDVREHVFEPFYTTKAEGEGTGLGLAVVYGIVRQHQGWIELETEPGVGTEFRIFLPRTEKKGEAEKKTAEEADPTGTENILVVDDEENVRALLLQLLASLGYSAQGASSGTEAIGMIEAESFDMVICDVVMPHMSGQETLRQIRQRKPGVKALLISGYANFSDDEDSSLDSAGERIPLMLKPFNRAKLARKIRALLDSDGSRLSSGEGI